jgi:transcriptional regulator with XRE-family HTH domain
MDNATVMTKIGSALRSRREELGYSQDRFADTIRMHRAYYGAIERGEKNLTISTLVRVAAGLEIRPSDVLSAAGM